MSLFLSHKYLNPFEEHKNGTYHHVAHSLSGSKSFYISHVVNYFYETEFDIWASPQAVCKITAISAEVSYFWGYILFSCYPAVTYAAAKLQGRLFWITFKWFKLLRKAGHLQLIQNSVPSVAGQPQCCIRIKTRVSAHCSAVSALKSWSTKELKKL